MQKSNKEAIESRCLEEESDSFRGKLTRIEKYEYDTYMHGKFFTLDIKISSDSSIYKQYQYLVVGHEDLLNFIDEGDSVLKSEGADKLTIVKVSNEKRSFIMPSCSQKVSQ